MTKPTPRKMRFNFKTTQTTHDEDAYCAMAGCVPVEPEPTYEVLLAAMRKYVIDQRECGNPARLQDLREFRQWKNMPQDEAYDTALLSEINVEPQEPGMEQAESPAPQHVAVAFNHLTGKKEVFSDGAHGEQPINAGAKLGSAMRYLNEQTPKNWDAVEILNKAWGEGFREWAKAKPKSPAPMSAREFYETVWSTRGEVEKRELHEQLLGTLDAAFNFAKSFAAQSQPSESQQQAIPEAELQRVAEKIANGCFPRDFTVPGILAILRTLEKKA